jgi:hypothetical protein
VTSAEASDNEPTVVTPRRRRVLIATIIAIVALGVALAAIVVTRHNSRSNTTTMSDRASQVMPFDLAATTHTFTKSDTGGVETVTALDPSDHRNIDLIRGHLQYEAGQFHNGNYSDPAKIHGMEMPGLKELEAGASRVDVRYHDVPAGAEITYSSTEPALVDALHAWFDRQSNDHAMPGMGG